MRWYNLPQHIDIYYMEDKIKRNSVGGNSKATQALIKHNQSRKLKDESVFVENSTYPRHRLKERLIKKNIVPYMCNCCGIGPTWNGKPMPLILDHINGIRNDNRISNLRFVCSNCDSQLDTYKARNIGRNS